MKKKIFVVIAILSFLGIMGTLGLFNEEVNTDDIAITGNANTIKETKETKEAKTTKTAKVEPIINVDAQTLSNAYTENEVTGDAAYKGKKCNVNGKISMISVVLGIPEVSLSVDDGFGAVICKFKNKSELTKLTKNQEVSILGICEGNPGFVVSMKECSIN
jgi:hypothetical protein